MEKCALDHLKKNKKKKEESPEMNMPHSAYASGRKPSTRMCSNVHSASKEGGGRAEGEKVEK